MAEHGYAFIGAESKCPSQRRSFTRASNWATSATLDFGAESKRQEKWRVKVLAPTEKQVEITPPSFHSQLVIAGPIEGPLLASTNRYEVEGIGR